jgi:erythromycin esterase
MDMRRHELDEIRRLARPLGGTDDLDLLVDRVGDARFVLIGEASHGTSDFYRWRADLSRRLLEEKGFSFVAVEGDWPDCYQVNRWVKDRHSDDESPEAVLKQFHRWPTWMWANEEVAEFVGWLRDHNRRTGAEVGFYGLDVYSLWESLSRIIEYLHRARPDALEAATRAFGCFEPYDEDPQAYAWATRMVPTDCEDEVVDLLLEVTKVESDAIDVDAEFDARQNAEVVAGAERYYRAMVQANNESWNVRDLHMADTLDRLMKHHGDEAKAIVWEHNTHVGDARGTDMSQAGMVNVGQVARERHGDANVVLVGFGTHHGEVIAAGAWGDPMEVLEVPPAPAETHEDLMHENAPQRSLLVFPESRGGPWLSARRGHRAIGVVYQPDLDRRRNWVPTIMGRRYDAFIYIDGTKALRPLHTLVSADATPETYPWGT